MDNAGHGELVLAHKGKANAYGSISHICRIRYKSLLAHIVVALMRWKISRSSARQAVMGDSGGETAVALHCPQASRLAGQAQLEASLQRLATRCRLGDLDARH
uniref:Uncharacterized protein n=1 Tax=Oryza rufipogon TaxID=4529 RepID=A0A0E0QWN0_ORYRU